MGTFLSKIWLAIPLVPDTLKHLWCQWLPGKGSPDHTWWRKDCYKGLWCGQSWNIRNLRQCKDWKDLWQAGKTHIHQEERRETYDNLYLWHSIRQRTDRTDKDREKRQRHMGVCLWCLGQCVESHRKRQCPVWEEEKPQKSHILFLKRIGINIVTTNI